MISGNVSFGDEPNWFLGTETIQESNSIEILGRLFSPSSSSNLMSTSINEYKRVGVPCIV